ncbi:MAG: ATP-grasp domain-containing protein [Candidatus Dormiibacterota bacterium]
MSVNSAKVVFVGPDPLPAMGGGLTAICSDGCGLSRASFPGWESFGGTGTSSTSALLRLPGVRDRLESQVEAIVVWKSSAEVEGIARELGIAVANSPALIARRIENKSHFSRGAALARLPIPPTKTGVAGPELRMAVRELPGPWVFQLARGFSGEQSYLARSEIDLEQLVDRFEGRSCRISHEVAGTPVTVTGVVSRERLLLGPACIQLTGLPSLTPHPLGSCGNDYGRPVPEPEAVREVALRTAEWLRLQGHLGVFGLDLVVGEDGGVWCIEVNPRLVASVPLFSLSARDLGVPGILNHHLASFGIGESAATELECHWSQVILYQRTDRLPDPLVRSGEGHYLDLGEFNSNGEMGLAGPSPGSAGLLVQARSRPGKELARLIFEGPCSSPGGALLPKLDTLVQRIRSQLELGSGRQDVS